MALDVLTTSAPNLHLPRILCLHGGGTNAKIFHAQCRILRQHLATTFRLVFAEAPFPSRAGPDVLSVYASCGPFKSWIIPADNNLEPEAGRKAIQDSLQAAIENDDLQGATGEWVGLLGFSQGAKIAASLLFCQQKREERLGLPPSGPRWRFAVLLAGRGPLVALDRNLLGIPGLVDVSSTSLTALPDELLRGRTEHILHLPTVHVHGTRDPGLVEHRKLLAQYCEEGTARLMEWEGEHRVPIKTRDVAALVGRIWDVAGETGVVMKAKEASELNLKDNTLSR